MSDPEDLVNIAKSETPTNVQNVEAVNNDSSTKSSSNSSWIPEASNWTCSWISTAKEKTKSTLETMKKDISEFSDTLQQGASTLASATVKQAQVIQNYIGSNLDDNESEDLQKSKTTESKDPNMEILVNSSSSDMDAKNKTITGGIIGGGLNWMKQMVDTVQKYATEDTTQDEDEFTEEIRLGPGGRRTLLDQFTLLQMQNDTRTFLQEPQENVDFYQEWLLDFKISEYNGEINMLLGYNPRLREIYAELVPAHVDNNSFWNRYFFKVHLKELDKQIAMGMDKQTALGTTTIKVNTNKTGVASSGIGAHSPAASNGGRDDWSMCSSEVTTEAEEIESGGEMVVSIDSNRDEAPTPRPEQEAEKNAPAEELDDWEECVDDQQQTEEPAQKASKNTNANEANSKQ